MYGVASHESRKQRSTKFHFLLSAALCGLRGLDRIDLLRFLAGCHKRRQNQALSILSFSLGIFECVCCAVN